MSAPDPQGPPKLVEPPRETGPPDPEAPDASHDIGPREEQALWWPNMEESRMILHDYVSQHEQPFPPGTELPDDPDPGDES